MNISIILSGGSGTRFGGERPKQYQALLGREVISYSIQALNDSLLTDQFIVVAEKDYVERLSSEYSVICIEGGSSRNASLRNALEYIKQSFPLCKNVFINEAARPFLTAEIVDIYYDYLSEYDAVITTRHITDSLGRNGDPVTNRDEYYLIQAPEAFRFETLYKNFSSNSTITATVQQLPADRKVKRFFEFRNNIKITYQEDLHIAEQLMQLRK